MRFRTVICSSFFTVLLISVSPFAQAQTTTLRGVVSNATDGSALVGANVIVHSSEGKRLGATATNVDGYYQIRDLPAGRHQIKVSFVGFRTHQDTLQLRGGRRTYNVTLTPSRQLLEEVQVEADQGVTQREAGVMTVGPADVERVPTPGPSGDLAAYLQTLSGVVSVGDRGGDLYIRGGTPSQNLILVDGFRIMKPFHISGLYSAFSEDIIRNVDVNLGGFGAQYMGATSSVLDVTLRKGNMKTYQASGSVSPFLTSARIEGPIAEGQQSFLALARYSVIEEAADPLIGQAVPIDFYDVTTRYSLQTENASCNATGIRTSDRGRINPNRALVLSWTNTVLGGRCLFFGNRLDYALDLYFGYSQFENQAGTREAPQRSASLDKLFIGFDSKREVFGTTLNYGGQWVANMYRYELDEKFTSLQLQDKSGGVLQAYASMSWTFDRLTFTPSLGSQITVSRFIPTFEPRLRITYRPTGTERQELSFAAGIYNQMDYGISDEQDAGTVFRIWRPSERSEPLAQAFHGILGYRHEIGSSVEISLEGYVKALNDIPIPEWSPIAKFDTETTLANGVAYGADVRATMKNSRVYLSLGYGWSTATYRAARENLGAWVDGEIVSYHPAHDRRHQLNLLASTEFWGITANTSWEIASGRPYTKVSLFDLALDLTREAPSTSAGTPLIFYDRPYNARLPIYHRLDVSLERTFNLSPSLSLSAKVGAINTYDQPNVFYYDLKTLERVNQTPLLPYVSLRVQID